MSNDKFDTARQVLRQQKLTGERALFQSENLAVYDSVFEDGESPLKESSSLYLDNCLFRWKYPLWYCKHVDVKECTWFDMALYRMIENEELEQKILLQKEFYTDDHCYWPKKEDGQAKQEQAVRNQNQWNKIARQTKMEQEMRGGETTDGEDLFLAQAAAEKSRRSYKDFLQRFSVLREEIGVDPEEFDLNYYTYGLKLYGNMPLMEPLESREVKKIREFVIAIDTSYSTSGTLVEQFLKETFSILTQKNSFFAQSKIRVIQCDNQIRSDVELKSERDIAALMQEFTFAGGGSTDFRPVFSYINDLIERGELKNLGGLLYFTDGRGAYPKIRPEYQTAFLFLEDYDDTAVPPWAIRLKLEPEEFEGQNAKG